MEGPKMSVSRTPERRPRRAKDNARLTIHDQRNRSDSLSSIPDIVDFPTPPFADETAMTFLTSFILLLSGRPRCMRGMLPVRGKPWGL